jgi:hypothetical protein
MVCLAFAKTIALRKSVYMLYQCFNFGAYFCRQDSANVLRIVSPDNIVGAHTDLDSPSRNLEDSLCHFEKRVICNTSNQHNTIFNAYVGHLVIELLSVNKWQAHGMEAMKAQEVRDRLALIVCSL